MVLSRVCVIQFSGEEKLDKDSLWRDLKIKRAAKKSRAATQESPIYAIDYADIDSVANFV